MGLIIRFHTFIYLFELKMLCWSLKALEKTARVERYGFKKKSNKWNAYVM